jgi:hypothetical protein
VQRRAENRRHQRRHHGAVQPVLGRETGERRERDALRQHDDGADQARDRVGPERRRVDSRPPFQQGEKALRERGVRGGRGRHVEASTESLWYQTRSRRSLRAILSAFPAAYFPPPHAMLELRKSGLTLMLVAREPAAA